MSLLGGKHAVANIIDLIGSHKDKFHLVEGHTSIMGLTNIARVIELSNECVAYAKAMREFENNPFEPATLDNAYEAYFDMCTACQVFTSQVDADFDARDILDLETIKGVFDSIIQCNIALKHPDECKPLKILDTSITQTLIQICSAFNSDVEAYAKLIMDGIQMEETKTQDPLIKFTVLPKQKYFTDAEIQSVREAEIRHQEEQQKAKEAAELGKKFQQFMIMLSKVSFEGDIEKARRYLSCLTQEEILNGYKTLDGIVFDNARFTAQLGARFQTIGDLEFQLKDNGTAEGMRCAGKLMSRISGNIVTIKSLDTSVNYSDPDNTTDPKKDEWVIMIASHHES